jgi:exodeoxyribonuclease-3
MKIITWNVNGIRAVTKKEDWKKFFEKYDPDILCLNETKAQKDQLTHEHMGGDEYTVQFHSAKKKGYSGVAIYSKTEPLNIIEGLGIEEFDNEGRVLTFEYENYYVISTYVLNAQHGLKRIKEREAFNDALLNFMNNLQAKKPVILCGDLNVAPQEIDLKNPKTNRGNPGFSDEERAKFQEMLDEGYIDVFRAFYPDTIQYTWWSYRFSARTKNIGWRIDHFITHKDFKKNIKDIKVLDDVMGSDHCPVMLELQ